MLGEIGIFMGVRVILNDQLVVNTGREDWSRVRSPGRARRRRAKHRQNIRPIMAPDPNAYRMPNGIMVMHPATARQFAEAASAQVR